MLVLYRGSYRTVNYPKFKLICRMFQCEMHVEPVFAKTYHKNIMYCAKIHLIQWFSCNWHNKSQDLNIHEMSHVFGITNSPSVRCSECVCVCWLGWMCVIFCFIISVVLCEMGKFMGFSRFLLFSTENLQFKFPFFCWFFFLLRIRNT